MRALAVGLLCVLGTAACHSRRAPAVTPAAEPPSVRTGDQAARRPVGPVTEVAELLPAQTQAWLEFKSARRMMEVFERERFESRFAGQYREVAGELGEVFGVDPLDVDNLPALGIDPDAEVGVFVLDAEHNAAGVYARVLDVARARETVLAATMKANYAVRHEPREGAEVFRDKYDNLVVVLREPYLVVLAVDPRPDGTATHWVDRLVETTADRSLAASDGMQTVLSGYDDADARAFVNPAAILSTAFEHPHVPGNWAAEALAEARASGAPPERIAELQRQVAEVDADNERWQARQRAKQALIEELLQPIAAVGIRADRKPRGFMMQLRALLAEDALLRRMIRNTQGPPRLTTALDHRPLFLLEGTADAAGVGEFLSMVALAQGRTSATLLAEVSRDTGVDWQSEVLPLLTGQAGVAVTVDGTPSFADRDRVPSAFGATGYVAVRDETEAKAVLEAVAPRLRIDGKRLRRDKKSGMWAFDVPRWRPLFVSVAGGALVVTTDDALPGRMAAGKPGRIAARTTPEGAFAAMARGEQSLTYASDVGAFGWLFWGTMDSALPPVAMEPPELADAPKSRRYRRKKAELDKLDKRIFALEQEASAARMAEQFELMEALGVTVMTGRETTEGFLIDGGQYLRERSLVDVVQRFTELDRGGTTPNDELDRLWQERRELQDELFRIRDDDLSKNPPKAALGP